MRLDPCRFGYKVNNPVCPYCLTVRNIDPDLNYKDGDKFIVDCSNCGHSFVVEVNIVISYDSSHKTVGD